MTGEDICAPLLIGPRVHVYKEGRLFAKSSPLRSKRPVSVTLTGTILTLCDNAQSKPRKYNLENGRLLTHAPSNKLVLRLASEKVSLFANSKEDFQEWIAVLSDAMYWHVQRFYEFGDVVGKGAFATVVKGRHKVSGESVAIKVVGKGDCNAEEVKYLQREINIVERMHHRNVVQMVDLFESKRNLYMVLEYIPGGTLQTFVERHGPLEERHAKNVMRDVLTAVEYIHGMSVVHRDIKPENMLCTSKELPMTVKVMDFGLGRHTKWRPNTPNTSDTDDDTLGPDGLMTTPVGTPHFVAPEILMSIPYGKEIDLFATGVVMYWLLSGKLPFAAEEGDMLMDQIKQTEYSFPEEEWRHVSDEAKGLIDGLLERSPYARFSASDALGHEWFLGGHVGALVLGKAGSGEFGENPFSPRGRVERRMTLDGSEDGEDENGGL